jgi:hypothetical protein
MGFIPPKGVRPPQFEGRRSGRPKGSKNMARAWRDAIWGYEHREHVLGGSVEELASALDSLRA